MFLMKKKDIKWTAGYFHKEINRRYTGISSHWDYPGLEKVELAMKQKKLYKLDKSQKIRDLTFLCIQNHEHKCLAKAHGHHCVKKALVLNGLLTCTYQPNSCIKATDELCKC